MEIIVFGVKSGIEPAFYLTGCTFDYLFFGHVGDSVCPNSCALTALFSRNLSGSRPGLRDVVKLTVNHTWMGWVDFTG